MCSMVRRKKRGLFRKVPTMQAMTPADCWLMPMAARVHLRHADKQGSLLPYKPSETAVYNDDEGDTCNIWCLRMWDIMSVMHEAYLEGEAKKDFESGLPRWMYLAVDDAGIVADFKHWCVIMCDHTSAVPLSLHDAFTSWAEKSGDAGSSAFASAVVTSIN